MQRHKILFIGGSLNQTTIVHTVAKHLHDDYDCYFTPYYCTGLLRQLSRKGLTEFTILGAKARSMTLEYLHDHGLKIDHEGRLHDYTLIVTPSDLIVQKNIRKRRIVLIQEGMTDPQNFMYYLVKLLKLPRYLASTSTTGLSHRYEAFCVASEGYRDLFVRKGVRPEKIEVTGIPNFDNARQYLDNDFPHRNYVLVATSDARETLKLDSRTKFLRRALEIAGDRKTIFKLHPNEKVERATREIKAVAPHAIVYADGNTNHMIANCDVLVTQYSSVVYVGLALDKEVHSYFDVEELKKLLPIQNGGRSAENIASVCRRVIRTVRRPRPGRPIRTLPNLKLLRGLSFIHENRYGYTG